LEDLRPLIGKADPQRQAALVAHPRWAAMAARATGVLRVDLTQSAQLLDGLGAQKEHALARMMLALLAPEWPGRQNLRAAGRCCKTRRGAESHR
jgi:hypothetical protein